MGFLFNLDVMQLTLDLFSVKEWMSKCSLKSLGVPKFIASGQHESNGQKYRFMVIQRFGTDLQKLFEENGKQFPVHTVFLLGLKLVCNLFYFINNL